MSDGPVVRRGDVWLVALDPAGTSAEARTPACVIVQRDVANDVIPTTIVVPIADALDRKRSVVRPRFAAGTGGLAKASVALCNEVRIVERRRLRLRLGTLDAAALRDVERGLIEMLDLADARGAGA